MFYKKSVEETLSQVNSSLKGLSSSKASELLKKYGPNELKEKFKDHLEKTLSIYK